MPCDPEYFAVHSYVVQRSILDDKFVSFHLNYSLACATAGKMNLQDTHMPGTPSAYAEPMMEHLLEKLRPNVETATGFSLFPTYSFLRLYKRGDVLRRHLDRPSCEISMTLNLGSSSTQPWPIWISGPRGIRSIALKPGDALIYRGCDCLHWREALTTDYVAQVFLHYVDRNGPNAEWKFDKRGALSLPESDLTSAL